MTIYYVDLENGDDTTGDGSAGNPYKTTSKGTTGLTGGDECRVAKSSDPESVGNATWTNGSSLVTLATACTKTITNCETAWTASADVTATADNLLESEGNSCAKIAPAAAFGTGILAYRDTGAQVDYSDYTRISLRFYATAAITSGNLELRTYSDAAATVLVDTLVFPTITYSVNACHAVVLDNAGALGSNIRSIALYAAADPGTTIFYLDNIIACKSAATAGALTHQSVISKNSDATGAYGGELWYPVYTIDDTAVEIGLQRQVMNKSALGAYGLYSGVTETVATYKNEGIHSGYDLGVSAAAQTIATSGTSLVDRVLVSGGWDLTGPAQDGFTWLLGEGNQGYGLLLSGKNYVEIENFGTIGYSQGIAATGTNAGLFIHDCKGCGTGTYGIGLLAYGAELENIEHTSCANALSPGYSVIRNITALTCMTVFYQLPKQVHNLIAKNILLTLVAYPSGRLDVYGAVFENVASYTAAERDGTTIIKNLTGTITFGAGNAYSHGRLYIDTYDDDPDDQRILSGVGTVQTQTAVRHTASGLAWQLSPTIAVPESRSINAKISRIRCKAATLVTVSCWFRRTHATNIDAKLLCRGGQIAGVASDVEDAMTAAADTWEQLSISFTPTSAGVVEIEAIAFGGTTESVYVDDISFS